VFVCLCPINTKTAELILKINKFFLKSTKKNVFPMYIRTYFRIEIEDGHEVP